MSSDLRELVFMAKFEEHRTENPNPNITIRPTYLLFDSAESFVDYLLKAGSSSTTLNSSFQLITWKSLSAISIGNGNLVHLQLLCGWYL
jgi:hypothetical protein